MSNPNEYLPYIIPYMFVIVSLLVGIIYLIKKKYHNQGVYDVTTSKVSSFDNIINIL